jgi:hypothetical protein
LPTSIRRKISKPKTALHQSRNFEHIFATEGTNEEQVETAPEKNVTGLTAALSGISGPRVRSMFRDLNQPKNQMQYRLRRQGKQQRTARAIEDTIKVSLNKDNGSKLM